MSRILTEAQATEKMARLKDIEWSLSNIEQHFALVLRAYEQAMEDQQRPLREERAIINTQLELWIRARAKGQLGRTWSCPSGTVTLRPSQRWTLGMGERKTAAKLLMLGYASALKLAVKRSALEGLSPEIRAVLEIGREQVSNVTIRLKGGPQ